MASMSEAHRHLAVGVSDDVLYRGIQRNQTGPVARDGLHRAGEHERPGDLEWPDDRSRRLGTKVTAKGSSVPAAAAHAYPTIVIDKAARASRQALTAEGKEP